MLLQANHEQAALIDWESYGVSHNGFLPSEPPLRWLSSPYYAPWEEIVHNLPSLIKADVVRRRVDELDVLTTSRLDGLAEWQRAYNILAFLAQAYVWGGQMPSQVLPPAISVPFLEVSGKLQLPPVATYAALGLWNWRPIDASVDIGRPQNLAALHTLTGTVDEEWFYMVSIAVEARGAKLLRLMVDTMHAAHAGQVTCVAAALGQFSESLHELSRLVEEMHDRCEPETFYHQIRPYLAGSQNMEVAGLPNGVFYDEGNGKGEWRKYRGGSNGQSSLIQFFDAVLGVEHASTGTGISFHEEMRRYMPGNHASFLDQVASLSKIRTLVSNSDPHGELAEAFNAAVTSLGAFRDVHMQLVARYVIVPSRRPAAAEGLSRKNLASGSTAANGLIDIHELRGTGGTKLMSFLRQVRDETKATAVT